MQSGNLFFSIAPVTAELTKAGSSPFHADTHTSAHFPKGLFPLIPPPIHIKFPSEPRPRITFSPKLQHLWSKQTNKFSTVRVVAAPVSAHNSNCTCLRIWHHYTCKLRGALCTPYTELGEFITVGRIIFLWATLICKLWLGKVHSLKSKSTKNATWEKALSHVFALISQKKDVLQCSPTSAAQLYYVVQACAAPTVSEESCYYGALKD